MTSMHRVALAAVLAAGFALPAAAQQSVTQADIQRLQDNVYLAERDISQLRSRDAARSGQLQTELEDLREEVIYLKVKLRKEQNLARSEYADVRDRIEDVRTRARNEGTSSLALPGTGATTAAGGSATAAPRTPPPPSTSTTTTSTTTTGPAGTTRIPAGTELDVRLQNSLNSGSAQVEDRFEGTTLVDVVVDGRTVIPAGSVMRGVVTAVEPATRTNRTARLTVSFDQVTVNNRAYPFRGTVTEAIEGEGIRGEAGRVGAGAGVGAIIGGILGGFKGALAGLIIGGGGTIAATEGKEVDLPQGAVLRVRVDSPVDIQTGR
jgi:hypothetical protein